MINKINPDTRLRNFCKTLNSSPRRTPGSSRNKCLLDPGFLRDDFSEHP